MNDFTLIIPTYNRPELLKRLLTYYAQSRFSYLILVADSSEERACKHNRETVAALPQLHIQHLPFPPATEIYNKITQAVSRVDSAYIGLCSDDDYLASKAPDRAMSFLENHPAYSALTGASFSGRVDHGKLLITPIHQRPNTKDSALARLKEQLIHPTGTFYAIRRRDTLGAHLDRIRRFRTDNTRFEELMFVSLDAIAGKIGVLGSLHMVRQSSGTRADSGSRQTKGWKHVISTPTFPNNREKFLSLVKEALRDARSTQEIEGLFEHYIRTKTAPHSRSTRATILERARAAALLPSAPTSWRRGLQLIEGGFLSLQPTTRQMKAEFQPIARHISAYPDGIAV